MAGARWVMSTSPSAPSASPWVRVTVLPAGPDNRTQPLMFCPRSTTCRPGAGAVIATGRSSSTRRTGGATAHTKPSNPISGASSTACHSPGVKVRSDFWPSIRSAARTTDSRAVQDSPVPPMTCPSTCTCARNDVRSPHCEDARSSPTWPRNQPSVSSAVISFRPGTRSDVTS